VLYTSFPVKSTIEIATSAPLFPVKAIVAFPLAGFGLTLNVLIAFVIGVYICVFFYNLQVCSSIF
jgi:hypothetical protein